MAWLTSTGFGLSPGHQYTFTSAGWCIAVSVNASMFRFCDAESDPHAPDAYSTLKSVPST